MTYNISTDPTFESYLVGVGCMNPDEVISRVEIKFPHLKGICYYDAENKCLGSRKPKDVHFYRDGIHGILEVSFKVIH